MSFSHFLVPTDFGESSEQALELALALAPKHGGQITLLHVAWLPPYYTSAYAEGLAWPTDELEGQARKELDALVARARERYPNVTGVVVAGEAWERILTAAKDRDADVIVMGTHGRRGISRVLLGSVAEKVVRLSSVPVLTVSSKAAGEAKAEALAAAAPRRPASKP